MAYESDTSWARELLQPGEKLLWTGKPGRVRLLEKKDLISLAIMLVLAALGGKLLWDFLQPEKKNYLGAVAVAAALAICVWRTLGGILGRFLALKRARYALTDRRVVARSGKGTKSLDLTDLPRMTAAQRDDGSGDLLFGAGTQPVDVPGGIGSGGLFRFGKSARNGFPAILELREIPNVDGLERLIREAAEQAKAARSQ